MYDPRPSQIGSDSAPGLVNLCPVFNERRERRDEKEHVRGMLIDLRDLFDVLVGTPRSLQ